MKTVQKRWLSWLLIGLLALSAVSCGEEKPQNETTSSNDSSDTSSVVEEGYVYPNVDLGGDKFTILNTAQTYGFYSSLDFDEATGDSLDDTIYTRNRFLEDKFNFEFNIIEEYELEAAATALQTSVLADDDTYDVAFIRDLYLLNAITEGYLTDLDGIPEIQLDEEWWDGAVTESARVGTSKKTFIASTDVSLADFEGTMVTFFNQDMFEKLNLELPYQLVLDGKWTFDKMVEYMKVGANLNGDDSFSPFEPSGAATYGLTGATHAYSSLISTAGIEFVSADKNGNLEFTMDSEKFYDVATKLSQSFAQDGEWLNSNVGDNSNPRHYEAIFKNGRALMLNAQLKAANSYRDMDSTYGIIPIPKWDESQENYSNLRTFSYLMVIPVTNKRINETGAIMDAMSYLTYEDVMPKFYDGKLSQKLLRNEESIEMLDLIRSTRHYEIAFVYSSFSKILNQIESIINSKSTDFASMVASLKPTIEANLESIMESMS